MNKEGLMLAVCFGQFGPYHHARVRALQELMAERGGRCVAVQVAGASTTYAWKTGDELRVTGKKWEGEARSAFAEELRTLCGGTEEGASPLGVFLAARKLFRSEGIEVVFVPSYSPARYFAIFAAAKSLGLKTVMMNESHAGTERARGWKKWVKRQIVRRFDAALVGGAPQKRHFAALGIPEEKIFTGYDAVDNDYFTEKAEEVRSLLTTD